MTRRSSAIAPRSLRRIASTGQAAMLVGLSAMLAPAPQAQAQVQAQPEEAEEAPLATMTVEDTAIDPNPNAQVGAPFKARTSGDERRTRPIAETPATQTVLTRAQIEQSGYTDLVRILDAQPGVTVGTGENGNAFGDRYIIRGQDVKSDIFVDGLRDPGLSTRESFAIEQIEITKGPNSSFAGRGTSGGAVNAITKAATTDMNFGRGDVGLGSDNHLRATADINYAAGDVFAIRVNGLYAKTDVPYRDLATRKRWGGAVSALFAPTDRLKIILDYYHLTARDKPDVGSFLLGDASVGQRVPFELPSYTQASDFQNSDVDTWTARLKYEFSDNLRLSNTFRYGTSYNAYFITGIGAQLATGPGGATYQTGRLDGGHGGWQDVDYIANQTNLRADLELFGAKHELIAGVEYTRHKVQTSVSPAFNTVNGTPGAASAFLLTRTGTPNCGTNFCITDSFGNAVPNLANLAGQSVVRTPFAARRWQVETVSGYLMDTVDITPALTAFAGVRVDRFSFDVGQFNTTTGAAQNFTNRTTNRFTYSDTLWNGHLGVTYKVGGGGMFYASVSTAADINGGEADTTGAGYGGFLLDDAASSDIALPERSWNYEIGTKWNVLDEKLLLTASLFRTVKSGIMEGADYGAFGSFNTGKLRVEGFELGVAGNITDKWSVHGGFTVMRAKVLESANPGINAAQLALGATNIGKTISNFANVSAQFMTRYQLTEKLALGGAFKYKSERYGGQPDTAAVYSQVGPGQFVYSQPVPSYVVADLSAEYHVTDNIELKLNVNNLFNTDYYLAAYRAGFFLYKGDKRQVVGTLSVKF